MNRPLSLAFLLLLAAPARAQSASDLYHEAARLYVGGEREAAEATAERGLRLTPDDPKLQALLDRIRQDPQQNSQGGQQNRQPNPEGEEGRQGNEGESQEDQTPREQGEPNPPEDDREGAPSDRPEEAQPPPEPADQPQPGREGQPPPDALRPGEGGPTPQSTEPLAPGTMTRAEAERILNAVGADERLLLRRIQRRPGEGRRVERDW